MGGAGIDATELPTVSKLGRRTRGPGRMRANAGMERRGHGRLAGGTLLGVLVGMLMLRHGRLVVDSDSVAQQSVVQTWLHAGHDETYLPPNTWLLKLPVYFLIESLPVSPSTRLLLESLSLAAAGYLLMAWACRWLAMEAGATRRWTDAVLPLAWLATLGGGLGQYLSVMPNSRNIELGLSFLLLMVAGRYVAGEVPAGSSGSAWRQLGRYASRGPVPVLLVAVLWVDDPYFAFLVGLPLLLACPVWYFARSRDRRLLALAMAVAVSLLAIPVLRGLLAAGGVHVVPDATGPTFSPVDVTGHVPLLWPSLKAQLGLSEYGAGAAVAHALTVAVLFASVLASGHLACRGWRARNLVLTFVAVNWLVVVGGVLVNRTVYDFHAGRYLVLALFDLAVCLGVAMAGLRSRHPRWASGIGALLLAAVLANGTAAVLGRPEEPLEAARQASILSMLRAAGLNKGYAQFWAANLYTYLSDGEVIVSDVSCRPGGRLRLRHWLTDTARLTVPAKRTFLLWDPIFRNCPPTRLEAQLGRPQAQLPGPAGTVILVYGHDLKDLLDQAP